MTSQIRSRPSAASAPTLDDGEAALWLLPAAAARPLEFVLSLYLGADPAHLVLDRPPGGKPRLREESTFDASLSRGGDTCLVAIARDLKIGVDVEPLRNGIETWSLVEQALTPREYARWTALPRERQASAFLSAWTRKEALLKAAGVGLNVDPRHVELGELGQVVRAPAELGRPDDWTLTEVAVDGHLIALATSGPVGRLDLHDARGRGREHAVLSARG